MGASNRPFIHALVNGLSGNLLPYVDKDYMARLYCSPQPESFHVVPTILTDSSKESQRNTRHGMRLRRSEADRFGQNRNATPLRSVPDEVHP
jgi:hypothetical protein